MSTSPAMYRSPVPPVETKVNRRRLASQSPSPERRQRSVPNGDDGWYLPGPGSKSDQRLGGGDSAQQQSYDDYCESDAEESDIITQSTQSMERTRHRFANLNVQPPAQYSDKAMPETKTARADDSRGDRPSPDVASSHSPAKLQESPSSVSSTSEVLQPYMGVIGKGRGRPLDGVGIAVEQQPGRNDGDGQLRQYPTVGIGRGRVLPPRLQKAAAESAQRGRRTKGPAFKAIGAGRGMVVESDNILEAIKPPTPYRDEKRHPLASRNESIASSDSNIELPSKYQDADCCGNDSMKPSRKCQPIDWSYAKEQFEIGKRDFGDARYIDTHCHIDLLFKRDGRYLGTFADYRAKRHESWASCYEGCIADFCYPVTFGPTKSLWESLMEEEGVYAAFGCHPHVASDYNDEVEKLIMDRLTHPKVLAVGEMGLDYSRNNNQDHDLQKDVFRKQLHLAVAYNKPLLIHCRDAEDDCFEIMKEIVPHDYRIHRHCWTGSLEDVQRWVNHFSNLKIGLTTGAFEPRLNQISLLREFPLDRIVIETDTPYFLPRFMHRKEFGGLECNHPGMGYLVACKLAEERNLEMTEVLKVIRANTRALYGI